MQAKKFTYFKVLLIAINLIAVLFVTAFIYITTQKICNNFIAREFLGSVSALPWKPYVNIYLSVGLFGILILTFIVREFIYPNNGRIVYLTLLIDFILSIVIVSVLNFNYNGILFLVIANIIAYTKGTRGKYVLMFISVLSIVITDYEMLSINFRLYSINDYISFYDAMTQQYLLGFYNIVVSTNILIFIVYCIYVIQNQRGTIDEVNSLYEQLRKANEDLQKANEQLKEYSRLMEKMGETKERNRLAREIHDTIGHTLTGISAGIDACITMVEKNPQETKKQLEMISWVNIKSGEGEIILTVRDNGIGCKDMKKGFGTRHIMERIKMLNGTVEFDGTNGFTVTARIPIRWGEEYD